MAIRPAHADDFAAITAITNHYVETTTVHFAYAPLAVEALRAMWAEQQDRHPWLVADEAGTVAGYAKAGPWRARAAYAWTTEIGLYVAPTARGRGLGTALYGALLPELARRGFRSAIAGITLPNDASLALHRTFGFASVGIVREAGWKHGRWCDVEFFQKQLATGDAPPPGAPA